MSVEDKMVKEITDYYVALQEEIKALKSQIGLIQKRNIDLLDSNSGLEYSSGLERLFEAINKTQQQCLDEIRAND